MTTQMERSSLWEAVIDVVGHSPAPPHREPLSEKLEQVMRHHVAAEEDSMESYRELVRGGGDPVVQLLMRAVLEDEEHHHGLLQRLMVQFEQEMDPATPGEGLGLGPPEGPSTPGLAAMAETLADQEREGVHRLRKLAKEYKDVYSGLFSVLIDGIASDSEKHERVLRFVGRRLRADS